MDTIEIKVPNYNQLGFSGLFVVSLSFFCFDFWPGRLQVS